MERTKEHNKKISDSMKRYFENETKEHRQKRIETLKRVKHIQSVLYRKYKNLADSVIEEIEI